MTDVTVLLGSRFATLEAHGTRWRALLVRWAADPRVGRLDVVDYPRFRPGRSAVVPAPSWLDGVRLLHATVPAHRTRTGPWDRLAWQATARAVRSATGDDRVVVCATPLWASLLTRLPATRRCFDAVDDWRALPSVAPQRRRVDAGYRAAAAADVVTSVSPVLADRLRDELGLDPVVVANGVDLAAFRPGAPAPDGLPDGPFAVYAGSVQSRVDLDLLAAVAARVPVVVAGPADADAAAALRASGATWLGPLDVGLVPGLLQRAAVGLVPHRLDALTASMDPMKLLEYLAAGLPVVATPLPGAALSERVVLAEGSGFVDAAVAALAGPRPAGPDPVVLDRGWDAVADRLLTLCLGGP